METAQLTINSATFKEMPIRAIRRSHIETWIKEMQTGTTVHKPFAPSTIAVRFNHLHHVFRAAVADRIIPVDPAENIRVPRRSRAGVAIPSVDEIRAAMTGAEDFFRPIVALAAFAGLRRGEACGIQLGDVDFLRRTVSISRQVQRGEQGRGDVRPPKHGSERDVYLPDDLVTMLSTVKPYEGGWLLPGNDGPPGPHMINVWWSSALRAAGITRRIRFHDCRHFYASGLIAAGCDVVTVQRAMGHTSATTTLTIYSHLWPTAEDRTRAAAADLMREVADSLRTVSVQNAAD
jgi:integrase